MKLAKFHTAQYGMLANNYSVYTAVQAQDVAGVQEVACGVTEIQMRNGITRYYVKERLDEVLDILACGRIRNEDERK